MKILKQCGLLLCGDKAFELRYTLKICKHLSKATSLNSSQFFCRPYFSMLIAYWFDRWYGLRLLMSFSYDVNHYNEMWRNLKSSSLKIWQFWIYHNSQWVKIRKNLLFGVTFSNSKCGGLEIGGLDLKFWHQLKLGMMWKKAANFESINIDPKSFKTNLNFGTFHNIIRNFSWQFLKFLN